MTKNEALTRAQSNAYLDIKTYVLNTDDDAWDFKSVLTNMVQAKQNILREIERTFEEGEEDE